MTLLDATPSVAATAVPTDRQSRPARASWLVRHLGERLSGGEDGKPRVFRDTAVENLSEFFQRFRRLNVRSNVQLDELVDRAERVIRGVGAEDLRNSGDLRQRVTAQLAAVQSKLDGLLVDKPRRKILRTAIAVTEGAA